jgi:hypothetical protein
MFTPDAKTNPFNYWTQLGIKQEMFLKYRQLIASTYHKRKGAYLKELNHHVML